MTWNHNKNIPHTGKAFAKVRVGREVRRELDSREVANVFAVNNHRLEQVELEDPAKPDITAGSSELQRQRRAP